MQSATAPHSQNHPHSQSHLPQSARSSAQSTTMADDDEGSDWGLAPSKPGFSRENKFILFVLLVLVVVFSFVVFRNFQKKQNGAKADEVASQDGKTSAKTGTAGDAKSKAAAKDGHPSVAKSEEDPFTNSATAPAEDPFGNGSAGNAHEQHPHSGSEMAGTGAGHHESAAGEHETATRPRNSRESTELTEVPPTQELDASPQLNAATEEPSAEGQTADVFEGPGLETAGTGISVPEVAENETPATVPPAAAEFAESPPAGHRGRRRQVHAKPAAVVEETPAEFAAPMEQPAEVAAFDANATEVAATGDFAQTGGTAAEPIRRRNAPPRAPGLETAQVGAPVDQFGVTTPNVPTSPGTAPRTTPRTAQPATAPRTAVTPTSPRTATPPPIPAVPPPLDPNDERLGGYREGELVPQGATPRTANRQPALGHSGQFSHSQEPLVANSGEYVIRPNDNFWRISRKVYGTARYFAALAKHNSPTISDPRHMKPGLKILTPPRELLEQQYGNLLPAAAAPRPVGAVTSSPNAPKTPGFYVESDGQPAYRIGPSDTLSSISQKTLGRSSRWIEIYELNHDRLTGADALAVGSILRLPPDASQSRVVGRPVEQH